MRLTVIYSNTSLGGHKRLYARLKELDSPAAKHVFLVPDRFTLGVERDIIDNVFPEGFSRVDVASFTRFAVKHVGKRIKKCLSKEGTVVLLERLLEENSDSLKYFRRVKGYNFAKELFAATASLRTAGITPERIEETIKDRRGRLWEKLSDIALIMREYEKYLAESHSDTITRIDELIKTVNAGAFADVNFYVLGFNMYSAQQLALLKALALNSASLNIAAVKSKKFYDPSAELRPLRDFCEERLVPVETEEVFELIDGDFDAVREGIFCGGRKHSTDKIRLYEASTPTDEISAVAKEIVYLTRKSDYRYRDIAVVCNEPSYLPYIREIFDGCDIPCFIDEGYNVLDGLGVKYVVYLAEACDELSQEKVFRFILHPFCGFDRRELGVFRGYCIKYNIKYARFKEPFTLGDCAEAEKIRKRVIEKLILPDRGTMADYCIRFAELTEGFGERLEELAADGDPRLVASARTEKFLTLLEETEKLIGEREVTVGEAVGLIKSAAAELKTVLRPDNYDVVFVGNTDESRFSDVKTMFVIGAGDGSFPKSSGDGLIFGMAENEAMRRCGLEIFPTPEIRNSFEQYVVYDLMSRPLHRMYISYSVTDSSGEAACSGDAYKEIAYITDSDGSRSYADYHGLDEDGILAYNLATDKHAYREFIAGNVPEKYRAAVEKRLIEKGLLIKKDAVGKAESFESCFSKNADGEYVTSVSQLETYFKCPFRHYMKYCLKAAEPDKEALNPSALGTAIHNVLEVFFKTYLDRLYTENLDSEAAEVIEREFSKSDYVAFYTDPLAAHVLKSTKKECLRIVRGLTDALRASKFKPEGFEVTFGYQNDENRIPITVNGRNFRFRGKIDRVDGRGDDVIIIDYKTGRVEPTLTDVYTGEKIQLYVYLSYFVGQGRRPAGVFYLPIRAGAQKGGNRYTLVGQMRNDAEVFRAIDSGCPEEDGRYESPYIALKPTVKKGKMTFPKQKNAISEEDFGNITDYVFKLATKGLEEISDGYAERKPLDGACEYCPYRSMCGDVPARKAGAVSVSDFALKKEIDDEQL